MYFLKYIIRKIRHFDNSLIYLWLIVLIHNHNNDKKNLNFQPNISADKQMNSEEINRKYCEIKIGIYKSLMLCMVLIVKLFLI